MKYFIITISLLLSFTTCKNDESNNQETNPNQSHKVLVKDVLQTQNYTYREF